MKEKTVVKKNHKKGGIGGFLAVVLGLLMWGGLEFAARQVCASPYVLYAERLNDEYFSLIWTAVFLLLRAILLWPIFLGYIRKRKKGSSVLYYYYPIKRLLKVFGIKILLDILVIFTGIICLAPYGALTHFGHLKFGIAALIFGLAVWVFLSILYLIKTVKKICRV